MFSLFIIIYFILLQYLYSTFIINEMTFLGYLFSFISISFMPKIGHDKDRKRRLRLFNFRIDRTCVNTASVEMCAAYRSIPCIETALKRSSVSPRVVSNGSKGACAL
jgi:hypothetical protein